MAYMHLEILTHAGDLELLKSTYMSLCMYIYMHINTQSDIPIICLHLFYKKILGTIRSV